MIVQKQLENFKQELHKEIDLIFKMPSLDDSNYQIKMTDFSKKSEQFYKKYFKLCKDTNDVLFENDISIPLIHKERYRKQKIQDSLKYDSKVMPLLETINMLSSPGTHEFAPFSSMLADSIKFLFTCYAFMFSMYLPKWIKKIDDIKTLNDPAVQLKKLLNSIGDDIYLCFNTANIDSQAKIPLTMLYGSELQDRLNIQVAEHLASEELAFKIATQVLNQHKGKLDIKTILDGITETKFVIDNDNDERLQIAYQKLLSVMIDIFMSNLTSHLIASPLKPNVLTTATKMKLIDLKNSLIREIEQEFNRIK